MCIYIVLLIIFNASYAANFLHLLAYILSALIGFAYIPLPGFIEVLHFSIDAAPLLSPRGYLPPLLRHYFFGFSINLLLTYFLFRFFFGFWFFF